MEKDKNTMSQGKTMKDPSEAQRKIKLDTEAATDKINRKDLNRERKKNHK